MYKRQGYFLKAANTVFIETHHLTSPVLRFCIFYIHSVNFCCKKRCLITTCAGADFYNNILIIIWVFGKQENFQFLFQFLNSLDVYKRQKQDPSADIEYASDTQWHGVSTYAVEKSAITSLPFVTNFNTGSGYSFFKNGEQISTLDWNNRSIGDILPTYRWMMDHEGENKLTAYFDVGNAWYGGSSLKLLGNMGKDDSSVIHLYLSLIHIYLSQEYILCRFFRLLRICFSLSRLRHKHQLYRK